VALGTPTLLVKGDDTTARTTAPGYQTTSITPTANAAVVLAVVSGTNQPVTSVTGCGLTWTIMDNQPFNATNHRLTWVRGIGASPTAGIVEINFASGAASGASWMIVQTTGAATGGTDGSAAYAQTLKKIEIVGASTGAATLDTFVDATNNIGLVAYAVDNDTAITPEGGWTKIDEQQGTIPDRTIAMAYKVGGSDLTAGATWTGTIDGAIIAAELTEAGAGGSGPLLSARRNRLVVAA
jgi:hypothetical protein